MGEEEPEAEASGFSCVFVFVKTHGETREFLWTFLAKYDKIHRIYTRNYAGADALAAAIEE